MKGGKFFLYSILMALLAAVITLITWQMNGFVVETSTPLTYITFVAWAAYFLIGANPKDAAVGLASAVAGIVAAALMFVFSILFGFVPWWAVPVAVFIIVPFMCYCEKVKPIRNTSMVFMATGLYFSLSAAGAFNGPGFTFQGYCLAGIAEVVYIVIGFVAGWASIQIFTFCSKLKGGQAE